MLVLAIVNRPAVFIYPAFLSSTVIILAPLKVWYARPTEPPTDAVVLVVGFNYLSRRFGVLTWETEAATESARVSSFCLSHLTTRQRAAEIESKDIIARKERHKAYSRSNRSRR